LNLRYFPRLAKTDLALKSEAHFDSVGCCDFTD